MLTKTWENAFLVLILIENSLKCVIEYIYFGLVINNQFIPQLQMKLDNSMAKGVTELGLTEDFE